MKIICYDGENITFLRLYRLRFENEIKDFEKLSLIVKKDYLNIQCSNIKH